jgi:hypothetical protein
MVTVYRLVGYDRTSEFLEERHDIPAGQVAPAKRTAGIGAAESELLGDWPLSDDQARAIAELIHLAIDLAHRDYFLEPYVMPEGAPRHPQETRAA